jgi:hypothetical protein
MTRYWANYLLVPPDISDWVAFVLGGDTAVPGGECAPEASSGFEPTGVGWAGDRYAPGLVQGAVATTVGAAFPLSFNPLR